VRDATLTDHPVLDTALERVERHRPQKPSQALPHLTKGLRSSVYQGLEARGIVHHRRARLLGLVPTREWPAVDTAHEEEVRRALHDVLVVGRTPDRREALLVSLLQAIDQLPRVLDVSGEEKRRVRSRGKELAEDEIAGEAVGRAVMAVRAAVTAAVAAAAAATSGG
jgi:predicted Ser/Thr protein kinase